MRKSCPPLLSLPVVLILPFAANAEPPKSVEEIVVTASRVEKPLATIPNTITVINEVELQRQLAVQHDLSTVLGNMIPSFSPSRQKMTSAGESLRGRKPLYMIDGVPQSNPLRNGGRDGHTIDPAVIERVEVLHGANAIHGLGAAGGIINLITRDPADGLQQNYSLETGVQPEDVGESLTYAGSYSVSNRFDQADVLASVSYRSTGMGYDANGDVVGVDNTQGDTMDSKTSNIFLKTGYNWSDQRLEFMVNRYNVVSDNEWVSVSGNVAEGVPSSAVKGEIIGKGARNRVLAISATYDNEEFLTHNLRVQAFRQDFEGTYGAEALPIETFQDEETYGPGLIDQSQNNSEKHGLKVTLSKEQVGGLPVSVVYGLDLLQDETWQALIQTGRTWVPESRYQNMAPFAQIEVTPADSFILTAGLRHEKSKLKVDNFTTLASYNGGQFVEGGNPEFSETLINLGAVYRITDAWRVFTNYAEAFSMPDVGRVLRGIDEPGQDVETFLDLKPILTENSEFGIEYSGTTVSAELSYYRSDSDFGQRLQQGDDGIYSVKREKTDVNGLELRGEWQMSGDDSLGLGYARTEGRYDSDQDGTVDSDLGGRDISPDRLNLYWNRDWSSSFSSRLQLNHMVDREFENREGAVVSKFDGYTTLDLSTQLQAFAGTISFAIQNLANTDYYTYYSQVSPSNRRYFKGFGRSYTLSWRSEF